MTYSDGDVLPERCFGPLTRTDFVRYQGASGDFNSIHHDEAFARAAGFPTVFSVGMLQAGYLATYVTDVFGPANIRRFKVQFREQVWPDDVLTCTGAVTSVTNADEALAELDLQVTTQTGAVAIKGSATVAI
ncbi:MaoC domain-containing protein [Nocardia nova SH22a]|uniref:MaoC domain-containing protein n=1 Tax=Nocardia nova SH22a TaxID=1415166 RepID=W5THH3_9NOCA|nr:MaoC/PaaZ C-terminal domain-containing protein [Nocardia nova]AHH18418.1 MaoC domain-containing protein [Nocardia nova SH22a]